jgi:hypothetical protein
LIDGPVRFGYLLSARDTKGRLTLHFLLGYAPELNHDELVWSHVKRAALPERLSERADRLFDEIVTQLAEIKKAPRLVRSFFIAPNGAPMMPPPCARQSIPRAWRARVLSRPSSKRSARHRDQNSRRKRLFARYVEANQHERARCAVRPSSGWLSRSLAPLRNARIDLLAARE